MPKTYSVSVDDPQLADRLPIAQRYRQPPNVSEDGVFILSLDSQDDGSGVLVGRVGPDVCEVQIQGHQNSMLRHTRACNRRRAGPLVPGDGTK
jgi:hypothetical protein